MLVPHPHSARLQAGAIGTTWVFAWLPEMRRVHSGPSTNMSCFLFGPHSKYPPWLSLASPGLESGGGSQPGVTLEPRPRPAPPHGAEHPPAPTCLALCLLPWPWLLHSPLSLAPLLLLLFSSSGTFCFNRTPVQPPSSLPSLGYNSPRSPFPCSSLHSDYCR